MNCDLVASLALLWECFDYNSHEMTHLLTKPSHCSRFQSFSVWSLHGPRFSTQPLHEEEEIHALQQHQLRVHRHDNELNSHSSHRNRHIEQPRPKIGRLVLVRHGQSQWNVTDPTRNLTARFVSKGRSIYFCGRRWTESLFRYPSPYSPLPFFANSNFVRRRRAGRILD